MAHIRILKHYFHAPYVILAGIEFVVLCMMAPLARMLRYGDLPNGMLETVPTALAFGVVMSLSMMSMGVYPSRIREGYTGMMLRTAVSFFLIGALALSVLFYLLQVTPMYRGTLFIAVALSFFVIAVLRLLISGWFEQASLKRRVLVIGTGRNSALIAGRMRRRADRRAFTIVGFLAVEGTPMLIDDGDARIIEPTDEHLLDLVDREDVEEVVVALDDRRQSDRRGTAEQANGDSRRSDAVVNLEHRSRMMRQLLDVRLSGVDVIDVLGFYERELGRIEVPLLRPSWMVYSDGFTSNAWRTYSKRAFDLLASGLLLLVTWPIMLVTAFAIWAESGFRHPVFYRQVRVGLDERNFEVLKFRSMRVDAERHGAQWASRQDDRITRVGHFIRNTRIDELPQILNVFRGEMSFVGPRPERPEFVERLKETIPYFSDRHRVKPGITGWAQLCYPYGASDEDSLQKLKYDLYYLKNHSLLLDLIIMVQTVEVVLVGDGAR